MMLVHILNFVLHFVIFFLSNLSHIIDLSILHRITMLLAMTIRSWMVFMTCMEY